jgi:methylglutaconyl-CoA hydratase
MNFKFITFKEDKSIAEVCFNRPEIHNAFNDEMILEVISIFQKIETMDSIRVVLLTGNGRSFCAGADLNWMSSMVDYTMEENIEDSKNLALMFNTINKCSKPVIGKINGHALGGGVGVVAVCDYVITHDKAKFGFTETRLGLIPAVISPFCIAKIGESHARAWFLSGERFDGNQGIRMGLIHEVTSLENFEKRSKEVIDSHLLAAPKAAGLAKNLIQSVITLEQKEHETYTCTAIAKQRISSEGQEGMKALLNKEKPSWVKND